MIISETTKQNQKTATFQIAWNYKTIVKKMAQSMQIQYVNMIIVIFKQLLRRQLKYVILSKVLIFLKLLVSKPAFERAGYKSVECKHKIKI